jgi:hypothetical protein
MAIKLKLVTWTYILQDKRSKFMLNESSICKLCEIETENMIHFLLKCIVLEPVRKQYIYRLNDIQAEISNIKLTDMSESTSDIIGQLSAVLSNKTKRDNINENGNDIKTVNLHTVRYRTLNLQRR